MEVQTLEAYVVGATDDVTLFDGFLVALGGGGGEPPGPTTKYYWTIDGTFAN